MSLQNVHEKSTICSTRTEGQLRLSSFNLPHASEAVIYSPWVSAMLLQHVTVFLHPGVSSRTSPATITWSIGLSSALDAHPDTHDPFIIHSIRPTLSNKYVGAQSVCQVLRYIGKSDRLSCHPENSARQVPSAGPSPWIPELSWTIRLSLSIHPGLPEVKTTSYQTLHPSPWSTSISVSKLIKWVRRINVRVTQWAPENYTSHKIKPRLPQWVVSWRTLLCRGDPPLWNWPLLDSLSHCQHCSCA